MKRVWSYSFYRAALRCNEETFALVTPDGTNALDSESAKRLIQTLNAGELVISKRMKKKGTK